MTDGAVLPVRHSLQTLHKEAAIAYKNYPLNTLKRLGHGINP